MTKEAIEKKEKMKYEDPCNPFSSNYNGTPVGPDSFGGSDYGDIPWEHEEKDNYGVEALKKQFQERLFGKENCIDPFETPKRETVPSPINNLNSAWIQTFTGRKLYPLNPRIEDICLEDIAYSLSRICRFNGHVKADHYSVAQHCVLVSYICDKEDAPHAVLHDGSEYGLGDFCAPLKKSGKFENYKEYEFNLQSMIYTAFGLSPIEPASVKEADIKLLATEARDLMSPLNKDWIQPCTPLPFTIVPLPPKEAFELYMNRCYELKITKKFNGGDISGNYPPPTVQGFIKHGRT